MAETTNISWADKTHNHFIGCTRVSPACDSCYAAHLMETRMGRVEWGGPGKGAGTRSLTSESNRRKPISWNKKAKASGARPFVFCSSLSDVFDNEIPAEWRQDLFNLIHKTEHLVWLLLTKRPQNIVKMVDAVGGLPENVALGATVEDQPRADKNLVALRAAKIELAPLFTFGSFEPLLERVTAPHGCLPDWVITGGETDQGKSKARPSNPDWFRHLRAQAEAAGSIYHHKQNGEFVAAGHECITDATANFPVDRSLGRLMVRVGKVMAGRSLDRQIFDARPEVR